MMMRAVFLFSIILLNYVGSSLANGFQSKDSILHNSDSVINIIGVGDIMFGTHFPSVKYLPPGNDAYPLIENVYHEVSDANVSFGNLEGSFLDNGKVVKRCKDTTKCYAFKSPEKYAGTLLDLGLDIVSLANNHINDFGTLGRETTKSILDSLGIEFAGLLEDPYTIFEKDSIIYGFCAFAPNTGTVSIHNLSRAKQIVSFLDDTCHIVIVSFHGGAEGSKYQHVTRETETFYGENRGNVYEFAHHMIDAGADIIFGHGPHVTRSIDIYKKRFIIYSLGNFCTYGRFNLSGPNGIAPIMKISVNHEGEFISGKIIPVYQNSEGKVKIDPLQRAIKKLQDLKHSDFPELKITIDDNGNISYLD